MRKIYLAARYRRRVELMSYADALKALGHTVTAQWVASDMPVQWVGGNEGKEEVSITIQHAIMDYEDVVRADLVISWTEPRGSANVGGGRHAEFGFAYAKGIENWLVGGREIIFHYLPGVRQFDDFEAVLAELKIT